MINIDDRFFDKTPIDSDECLLLLLIAIRVGKNGSAWPSNDLLCKQSGWSLKRLQSTKKRLIEKDLLDVSPQFNAGAQSSNLYTIKTPYITTYNGATPRSKQPRGDVSSHTPRPTPNRPTPPGSKRPNEVLTTEVLTNEVLIYADPADTAPTKKSFIKDAKVNAKPLRVKAPEDITITQAFNLSKDYWLNVFRPGWTFGGAQGKNLKELIKKLRTAAQTDNPNHEYLYASFQVLCQKLPEWFKDKDLPVINSKFNEIINQIKNGSTKKKSGFQRTGFFD